MASLLQLRDGSTTSDPRLGRLKQFDERSRSFAYGIVAGQPYGTRVWLPLAALDQLAEGTCVGHGFCHEANSTPLVPTKPRTHRDAVDWFDAAAAIDEFPGVNRSNGTSVLAGAKIGVKFGFFTGYRWAFTLDEVKAALFNEGPVVMGTDWLSGMYNTTQAGQLVVSGTTEGGHCWLVYGFVLKGDLNPLTGGPAPEDIFLMQNSWGLNWGIGGRAWMLASDYDWLRVNGGEVCIPVGRKDPTALIPVPKPAGYWKWVWNRLRRSWQRVWVST